MRRQVIAVLALLGALDSTYLLLHKLGYIGSLACTGGSAGCNAVNTSIYSSVLGVPVAGIGLAGYLVIFALAVFSAQPGRENDRRFDGLLAILAGAGAAFSLYLTYVSLFRIGTACPWCLVSLALIMSVFGIGLWGALERSNMPTAGRVNRTYE